MLPRLETMSLTIEVEQEEDGRWLAEVIELSGVLAYGQSRHEALALSVPEGNGWPLSLTVPDTEAVRDPQPTTALRAALFPCPRLSMGGNIG